MTPQKLEELIDRLEKESGKLGNSGELSTVCVQTLQSLPSDVLCLHTTFRPLRARLMLVPLFYIIPHYAFSAR